MAEYTRKNINMKQIIFFLIFPAFLFSQTGNFLLPDSAEIWRGASEGEIQLNDTVELHFVPEQFVHDFVIWPDSIPRQDTRIEPARKFYEQYPAYIPGVEQREKFRFDFSPYKYTIPTAFGSGLMDGWNQTLNFHYRKFKKVFPGANDQFWNPPISWENKYAKDGTGAVLTNYEAFPFSTTVLVWTTDGHHLTRAGDHLFMFATVGLYFSDLGKKNWKQIVLDVVVTSFARSAGFNTAYKIVF